MRKGEIVKRNISLVFDLLRYLIDHPELTEKLPDGCELEFLDKDFPLTETAMNVDGRERTFIKVDHSFDMAQGTIL